MSDTPIDRLNQMARESGIRTQEEELADTESELRIEIDPSLLTEGGPVLTDENAARILTSRFGGAPGDVRYNLMLRIV